VKTVPEVISHGICSHILISASNKYLFRYSAQYDSEIHQTSDGWGEESDREHEYSCIPTSPVNYQKHSGVVSSALFLTDMSGLLPPSPFSCVTRLSSPLYITNRFHNLDHSLVSLCQTTCCYRSKPTTQNLALCCVHNYFYCKLNEQLMREYRAVDLLQ